MKEMMFVRYAFHNTNMGKKTCYCMHFFSHYVNDDEALFYKNNSY